MIENRNESSLHDGLLSISILTPVHHVHGRNRSKKKIMEHSQSEGTLDQAVLVGQCVLTDLDLSSCSGMTVLSDALKNVH
jgi:hypothetical protein